MAREQDDSERQMAIEAAISTMEWEGAPIRVGGFEPSISSDQGIVSDGRKDPTHPLVRGRIETP